jgi:hypothetical protein
VSEVGTLVLDALVDLRYHLAPLCSLAGALRGLGETALSTGKLFHFFAKELRSRDALALRRGDDAFEPNVHTDYLGRLGERFRL